MMAKHFDSIAEFAVHFVETQAAIAASLHHGLERVATLVEQAAKAEIGHYQPGVGPFSAWPLLADSTEAAKAEAGYPEDAPLLASGDMMESIGHQLDGLTAVVGTADEKMVFHEFGTVNMPARPVLGPAAFSNKGAIQKLVGAALVAGLIGADQVHRALGYDFRTKN